MRFPPSLAKKKPIEQQKKAIEHEGLVEISLAEITDVKAERSVEGGGTGGEFPKNLALNGEEPWNKWY